MTRFPQNLSGRAVTTLCHCWRLIRADATVAGFTDHDRALTVDGTSFEPEAGFTATEARGTLGLGVDSADVEGALSSARITEADILEGLYDGASVETLLVDWTDPRNFTLLRQATIARIKRADGSFVAELESLGRGLDLVRGRRVRRNCDAELGDARCGVDLSGPQYRATGTVLSVAGRDRLLAGGLGAYAAGWFSDGTLTWSSGARAARSEPVVSFRHELDGTALTLWSGSLSEVRPGDEFSVVAGCDKRFATCKEKFSNFANFRGFPHMPGNDQAYSYVTESGTFDGAPIVP